VFSELLKSLTSCRSLADQLHVRLTGEQRRDAFTQHRMVVNGENAD
jgi:hypothetical protein